MKNITIKEGQGEIRLNPTIYPLEVIYSAAYSFLEKAYFLLDGDPKKEIIVEIRAKGEGNLQDIVHDFLDELIKYEDYRSRAEKTREIRELIIQRALFTNDPDAVSKADFDDFVEDLDNTENVDVPWEKQDE